MREVDPEEDDDSDDADNRYRVHEPSTWHPFLRVLLHKGVVAQVVDQFRSERGHRRPQPVVIQSNKPLGPPHIVDMEETVYFEVTFTQLAEHTRVSVGWATNRFPHDKHVGTFGVSLGFAVNSGKVSFCGEAPQPFLKAVGRDAKRCAVVGLVRGSDSEHGGCVQTLRSGDTLGCGLERISSFEAMTHGV